MPRATFTFEFEELPLVVEGGFEAGLVNGSAEIAYYPDGAWFIDGISLAGSKRLYWTLDDRVTAIRAGKTLPVFDRKPVELDAGSPLFLMIFERLENDWRAAVSDAVQEQITDRDDSPTRADHAAWLSDHVHDERKNWVGV